MFKQLRACLIATASLCAARAVDAQDPAKGSSSALALAVERDAESVRVLAGGSLVARYRHGGAIKKPYLAELALPGGRNVLLDAPPDHLHHHGVMLACKAGDVDFWGEAEGSGREAHVSLEATVEKDGTSAVIRGKLRWSDARERALLDEERTVRVLAPPDPKALVVLWESRLAPAEGAGPVTLAGSPYHGLGARFVRAMDRGGAFLASGGLTGVEGTNGKDAAWCAYAAEVAPGEPVTVAILDAPANPRHPARWFTMNDPFAYLSDTQAIGAKPVTLAAGESFALRAAVALLAGKAGEARLEDLHREVIQRVGWGKASEAAR
ncbi:MAG: PmoA family protein [Planctomycetes bacterium]|nr:PmoA family protein [Planctomycetota bacterium]